ncbi:class II aldolase/adducin family protein [Caballeronia choica]
MVLRNLGLLAAGEPAAKAFHEIYMLERACQAHIQAMVGGARLIVPGADVSGRTARQFEMDSSSGIIEIARNAALRLIEDSRP